MSRKVWVIIGLFVYLVMAVPAAYGLVRFFTSDVTGGKCVNEFTVDRFHKTSGVVHIPSSVIEVDGTQVVIQNMTCDKFKAETKRVNVFRYEHPYFSLYAILVLVGTLTAIVAWPIAGFFNWLITWREKRQKQESV